MSLKRRKADSAPRWRPCPTPAQPQQWRAVVEQEAQLPTPPGWQDALPLTTQPLARGAHKNPPYANKAAPLTGAPARDRWGARGATGNFSVRLFRSSLLILIPRQLPPPGTREILLKVDRQRFSGAGWQTLSCLVQHFELCLLALVLARSALPCTALGRSSPFSLAAMWLLPCERSVR